MAEYKLINKIMEKAVKNGFKYSYGVPCGQTSPESEEICEYSTFFSHDFAKAFWGEEMCMIIEDSACEFKHPFYKWENHLQQMVLEPEPLKYLEKFLTK